LAEVLPDHPIRQWLLDPKVDPSDKYVCTAPTGSYQANPRGLHDLHGNVWEWCRDHYKETYYRQFKPDPFNRQPATTDTNPLVENRSGEPIELRVIRGGSWCNGPLFCRSATRAFFDPTDAACYIGFRIVRPKGSPGG
jgi:formylglycine-generating enzyme required for sulfatase activity